MGRALLAVALGFFGVLTPLLTGTSSATVGPDLTFAIDPGGTITYVTPAPYGDPQTVIGSEPLTGSFTMHQDSDFGATSFRLTALHFQSASGKTVDMDGASYFGGMYCGVTRPDLLP